MAATKNTASTGSMKWWLHPLEFLLILFTVITLLLVFKSYTDNVAEALVFCQEYNTLHTDEVCIV